MTFGSTPRPKRPSRRGQTPQPLSRNLAEALAELERIIRARHDLATGQAIIDMVRRSEVRRAGQQARDEELQRLNDRVRQHRHEARALIHDYRVWRFHLPMTASMPDPRDAQFEDHRRRLSIARAFRQYRAVVTEYFDVARAYGRAKPTPTTDSEPRTLH